MYKKELTIILITSFLIHSAFSLNTKNFCTFKDKSRDCNKELYSYKCEKRNLCSVNITFCDLYEQMYAFYNTISYPSLQNTNIEGHKKFKMFNERIKFCKYEFEANDFCMNGENCREKKLVPFGYGYRYLTKNVECKCPPATQGLKCGKYCAVDATSCDYYQSNEKNMKQFGLNKIKICRNQNNTETRSFFHIS